MRKTKIICTLGPAVDSEEMIKKLIEEGMNAARFNFSHGTHESHLAQLVKLHRVRDELGVPVASILDTKGPEIRIKLIENGPVQLKTGEDFTLTTRDIMGSAQIASVTYNKLHEELKPGDCVLIDDGLIELTVSEIKGQDIICKIINGGALSSNKSMNLPNAQILLPYMTDKDRDDLRFAVEHDFDFIAASFVRNVSDIAEIRAELEKHGGEGIKIIAKIENREGVDNLDAIIEASDGVMVARGDLGVEIPAWDVPVLQKDMITRCIASGRPVIIATQMLESMTKNPRPTRAEVSDVANAVFDGTSCVMLSGETAGGKYPIEALRIMDEIIRATEASINYRQRFMRTTLSVGHTISDAISHTCCLAALDLDAKVILAATNSGNSARVISRFRPACPIIAITTTERIRRQLAISWGVHPYLSGLADSTDRMFSLCVECARKEGIVEPGDTVVITAGAPGGKVGTTNLIKAQKIT